MLYPSPDEAAALRHRYEPMTAHRAMTLDTVNKNSVSRRRVGMIHKGRLEV